jgi:zinc transport system substrate-binding protein
VFVPSQAAPLKIALRASCASLALLLAGAAPALAELKVTATIKPIHALVAQVMEGVGTPDLLVKGAASPHTYALKPSDARALNHAEVFFRVSETVEPFTRKIVTALPDTVKTVTLAEAPGVELLNVRTGDTFEKHDHAHDHGGADDHGEEAHGSRDGHVWLDPENGRKMIAEIARVLSEASPENADKFKANAARADAGLVALQADIARDLAPITAKPFVVFHDAFQYFEHRFGLSAVGSITVSPDTQPSAKRLTEIRRKLQNLSAVCVFSEPQFQAKLVNAVTEGTTARSGTLDPEGALVDPGPSAYDTLLRNLSDDLRACLAQAS